MAEEGDEGRARKMGRRKEGRKEDRAGGPEDRIKKGKQGGRAEEDNEGRIERGEGAEETVEEKRTELEEDKKDEGRRTRP